MTTDHLEINHSPSNAPPQHQYVSLLPGTFLLERVPYPYGRMFGSIRAWFAQINEEERGVLPSKWVSGAIGQVPQVLRRRGSVSNSYNVHVHSVLRGLKRISWRSLPNCSIWLCNVRALMLRGECTYQVIRVGDGLVGVDQIQVMPIRGVVL